MIITQMMVIFFFVFARISAFLMIAPGYSSDRLLLRSRLYLSVGVSVLICPFIKDIAYEENHMLEFNRIFMCVLHEIIIGFMLGLLFRIFQFAIETFITSFCLTIGIANIFSTEFLDNEMSPSLSSLIILCFVQLIFLSDLHHEFIKIIDNSFFLIPVSSYVNFELILKMIVTMLSKSYLITLNLTSPFLLFAIVVNLSFAFLARLSPQTPIYFVSGPFVILFGIYVFNICLSDMISSFIGSFHYLIVRG